jgi:hypothetical protein
VSTVNIGSRAPSYPLFIVALRERGPTAIHNMRPRSGRELNQFPDPEITLLTALSRHRNENGNGAPKSLSGERTKA